ncbi:MAG: helix-turn-helix domain-containing protein [Bosea sp.]|uniref:helix-turn-helix domain-containing protein n=1 Tax=Bosea sp. (in: a-proteobacteria) TaxID=1871050 RepID=UPI001AC34611|nr:helix-turn-helix domain-containing protein [Bosea sp. (in: a-proteobacteria)]
MSEISFQETPELLRVWDVAEALDVTTRTVERLIREGALAVTEIGGSVRVRRDELNRYIAAQTRRRGAAA